MVQLLIVLAAALICMGTGWWIGYRSRTTTTTLVLEPWPEDGEPLEPGSRDTQLEAARIAAANARHGLKEATEEADRSRKELEQLRVRADDREAKLRVTERMLSQVQEARVAAVNAQIAAEERLNAVRLEASTHAASADGELRRLRAEVGARDRALAAAETELSSLRPRVEHLERELQVTTSSLAAALAAAAPSPVDAPVVGPHVDRERLRAQLDEVMAERKALAIALEEQRAALEAERDALHADLANALLELEELRQVALAPERAWD